MSNIFRRQGRRSYKSMLSVCLSLLRSVSSTFFLRVTFLTYSFLLLFFYEVTLFYHLLIFPEISSFLIFRQRGPQNRAFCFFFLKFVYLIFPKTVCKENIVIFDFPPQIYSVIAKGAPDRSDCRIPESPISQNEWRHE